MRLLGTRRRAAGIKFAEKGRRVGATLLVAQWRNGEPIAVDPPDVDFAKPVWSQQ
jgi:branched-chain amino acid transport system substrate-binding protein